METGIRTKKGMTMGKYGWESPDPKSVPMQNATEALRFWHSEFTRLLDLAVQMAREGGHPQEEFDAVRMELAVAAARMSAYVPYVLPPF